MLNKETKIVIYYERPTQVFELLCKLQFEKSLIFVNGNKDSIQLWNSQDVVQPLDFNNFETLLKLKHTDDKTLMMIIETYLGLVDMIGICWSSGITKILDEIGKPYIIIYPNNQQDKQIQEIDNNISIFMTKTRYNDINHIQNLLIDAMYY